jgi:hypothetical protein
MMSNQALHSTALLRAAVSDPSVRPKGEDMRALVLSLVLTVGLSCIARAESSSFEFAGAKGRTVNVAVTFTKDSTTFVLDKPEGIGGLTITLASGDWPRDTVLVLPGFRNVESFAVTTDLFRAQTSLAQSGRAVLSLRNAKGKFDRADPTGPFLSAGTLDIRFSVTDDGLKVQFPPNLFAHTKQVQIGWIDFFRQ